MDKKVQIYTSPTCHYCHLAKDFFANHNVAYEEFDVMTNIDKRQEMIEKSGQMGVPVIVIGDPSNSSGQDELMVGFDENHLKGLLGL